MQIVKVYSRIHEAVLSDALDLPEPFKSEVRGQFRVLLETPFPHEGTSFFFAAYMDLSYLDTHRLNNLFIEEITMEHLAYRRTKAFPRKFK